MLRPFLTKSTPLKKRIGAGRKRQKRHAIAVRAPQSPSTKHLGRLILNGRAYPCALGKSGITGLKLEGDGATPRGFLAIVSGAYRPDRASMPQVKQTKSILFWNRIDPLQGWSDAAFTPAYNQPQRLPVSTSHEKMWREDHLYDRLIVLNWNIRPRSQARGSAIFLHQARIEHRTMKGTEGCIALPADVFERLAQQLSKLDAIIVR